MVQVPHSTACLCHKKERKKMVRNEVKYNGIFLLRVMSQQVGLFSVVFLQTFIYRSSYFHEDYNNWYFLFFFLRNYKNKNFFLQGLFFYDNFKRIIVYAFQSYHQNWWQILSPVIRFSHVSTDTPHLGKSCTWPLFQAAYIYNRLVSSIFNVTFAAFLWLIS